MPLIAYEGHFTSAVTSICDITRNRLQVWMDSGWIRASLEVSTGHGVRNLFSDADLDVVYFFKKATESGISRAAVASFLPMLYGNAKGLREQWLEKKEPIYLFFYRKRTGAYSHSIGYDHACMEGADDVMGFDYSQVIEHIHERIVDYLNED